MKVYKFYKTNCAGCYTMSRILNMIQIPADVEIIELNTDVLENKEFAKSKGVSLVPTLMREDGKMLTGGKTTKQEVIEFLGG